MPALEGMQFDAKASAWDENAERLSYMYADFSVMDWRYDEAEGRYMLWQDYQDPTSIITLAQTRDVGIRKPSGLITSSSCFPIIYGPELFDIDMREGDPEQRALLLRDGRMYWDVAIFGTRPAVHLLRHGWQPAEAEAGQHLDDLCQHDNPYQAGLTRELGPYLRA